MSNELLTIEDLQVLKIKITFPVGGYLVDSIEDLDVAVVNISKDLVREVDRLIEHSNDLSIVGLCVRNIFELFLIFIHIKSDENALRDWIGQSHKDITDIQDGLISLLQRSNIESPDLNNSKEDILKSAVAQGVEPKYNFNIKALANKYGYQEYYDAIYKLCSKLLHPSSLKINAYDAMNIENRFQSALIHVGVYFSALFIEHKTIA
jgi:hypothetical protein